MKQNIKNEKIKRILNSTIVKSLFVNLMLLGVLLVFFQPRFETPDDRYMENMVEGVYSSPNAHLVYINILLGKVWKFLYMKVGYINWYVLSQYALIFGSLCAVTWVILKKFREKELIRYLLLTFLIIVGYEGYIVVQFTRTAAIAAASGYFVMFYGLREKKIPPVIWGILLIFTASLYRYNIFLLVSGIMFNLGIYELVWLIKEHRKALKRWLFYIVSFSVLFSLVFFARTVNRKVYYSFDEEWKAYREFNSLRAKFVDFGILDWDEYQEEYEAIGISRNDWYVYSTLTYANSEEVSGETLQQMLEIKEQAGVSKNLLVSMLKESAAAITANILFWGFALIAAWGIYYQGKKYAVYVFHISFIIFLIELYFSYNGRSGLQRIELGYWISAILFLLYHMEAGISAVHEDQSKLTVVFSVICMMALGINGCLPSLRWNYDYVRKEELSRLFDEMSNDSGTLYWINTRDNLIHDATLCGTALPEGKASNIVELGGWLYPSPIIKERWEAWHVVNPLREIAERKEFYLVDYYDAASKLKYVQEHFYPSAGIYLVKRIYGVPVYKITKGIPELIEDENLKKADADIHTEVDCQLDNGNLIVGGHVYRKGKSSFSQNVYIKFSNEEIGLRYDYFTTQIENRKYEIEEERFDEFTFEMYTGNFPAGNYQVQVVVDFGSEGQYEIGQYEVNLEQ